MNYLLLKKMMKLILKIIGIVLFVAFLNCSKKSNKTSTNVQSNDKISLELLSEFAGKPNIIELVFVRSFQSNKQVFLDGSLSKSIIDDRDRVLIAVQRQGKLGIYVFNPNGDVETVMGRYGRGPGEFESISSMTISNDTLWVLDTRLEKISLFSLDNFKHLKDELIDKSLVIDESKFITLMKGKSLFSVNENEILMKFEVVSLQQPNMFTKSVYYRISSDGKILPPEVLNQDRYSMYIYKDRGNSRERGFTAPFTRTLLFTTNKKGNIYIAWSEDFRIRKYNTAGEYVKEFYYEMSKSSLDLDEVDIYKERKEFIEKQGVPDAWPALHTIQADDEGRLWVSAITDSDSTFSWFVINEENGNLIGAFTLKGKRSEITPFVGQPFFQIKNGFFYSREYSYEESIDRIVKYKIEFKK